MPFTTPVTFSADPCACCETTTCQDLLDAVALRTLSVWLTLAGPCTNPGIVDGIPLELVWDAVNHWFEYVGPLGNCGNTPDPPFHDYTVRLYCDGTDLKLIITNGSGVEIAYSTGNGSLTIDSDDPLLLTITPCADPGDPGSWAVFCTNPIPPSKTSNCCDGGTVEEL